MMRSIVSFSSLAAVALSKPVYTLKDAPVTGGLCDPNVKSLSGYINVHDSENDREDKNYFFWFFESRSNPETDPVAMWLTGGPGCSSQLALLTENGPCVATPDGLDTENNPYSWNSNSNIMWIDQPAGVGYSYGDKNDSNQAMVAEDLYNFLQGFFAAHSEYQANPFYVFGESYGGHYVPAISNRIYMGNKNDDGLHINLAGLGIGNGLTDPVVQYQYYPAMAMNNTYDIKCVSEEAYAEMVDHMPTCVNLAKACQFNESVCEKADSYCNSFETTPYYSTGLNPYDIRKPCGDNSLCYDFTNVETFLNLDSTRAALGVADEVKSWTECNTGVNMRFTSDWMRDYQQKLIPLLEDNVRVLVYAGDVDFICNWMGNKAWTQALHWSGKSSFDAETDQSWVYGVENVEGGLARTAAAKDGSGSLTFLQVYEAGHMVPMDQPEAALDMYNRFIFNRPFY